MMTMSEIKNLSFFLPWNALLTPSLERAKLVSRRFETHDLQQNLKDVSRLVDKNLWDMGSCLGKERRKPPGSW